MASLERIATAIAAFLPLIAVVTIISETSARELRPSDHGLEYQSPPPVGQKSPPEMKSFFGTTSSTPTANMARPRTMNSSDSSWWGSGGGDGGLGSGGDRLRHLLLVGSLVCGITGAALLVASAFVYLFRNQTQRSSSSTRNNKNSNTSIVIRR